MVQKRPYDDEEVFRISFKHPRQVEHTKELVSFSESVFTDDGSDLSPHSLEVGLTNAGTECDEKLSSDISADLPKDGIDEGTETSSPSCYATSSWPTTSKPPFHLPFFQQCFSPERPMRTSLSHCEEIYNILVNHATPRKTVPIGPDHQADIPPLEVSRSEADDDRRLMGKCVIPIPDSTFDAQTDPKVGSGRTDCDCEEKDSMGCVAKHIKEAREELLKTIGPDAFGELGFCDMGEEVSLRWTEAEEREFHRVVFSNRVLSGKNFWDKLSEAFPYLMKSEIVSYYFNVFMLRKRAAQNRYDPTNVDSDNDEWQGSGGGDDDDDDEDDSVVESPIISDETRDSNADLDSNQKINNYYRLGQVEEKETIRGDSPRNPIVSEKSGFAGLRTIHMESENGNHCQSSFSGYILEQCYAKDWDATGFVTCSKSKVDFLPTCNVIEEVFGEEI